MKHILIIDDERAIRLSCRLTLEEAGYKVDTAASGAEGIEMVIRNSYDLIFLDLKMPGMNGTEVLRKIRALYPHITIYIFTAFHFEFLSELQRAERDGIWFELLHKPIGGDQLVEIVKGVLS